MTPFSHMLYRQARAFPVTHVNLVFPHSGACQDPADRQGLSLLTLKMLLKGAGGMPSGEFNRAMERLGASMQVNLSSDTLSLRLVTLTASLDQTLALFLTALTRPNMEEEAFRQLRQEALSNWIAEREENKRTRVRDVYLSAQYGQGPLAYGTDGTRQGLEAIRVEDCRRRHQEMLAGSRPLLAVLSDLTQEEIEARVAARFSFPTPGAPAPYPWDTFRPPQPNGRQAVVIADPETQTEELMAGFFSVHEADPRWHVHRLVQLIFGGDMNSRLFRVIRGERGYSYGASCWYEAGRGRAPRNRPAPFTLYTFPSVEHTPQALPLLVGLYEELVEKGVTDEELSRAKSALIHSHAFLMDTPQKQLALDVDRVLYGINPDPPEENQRKLESVTPAEVLSTLRESHFPGALRLVMLGNPDRLAPLARAVPGMDSVEVVQYP
ncbi:MAG: insulinase family protein [Deltaproteobacteria bacterium]|nr:insulinase family protein [Deltaproteobacteria bacterium]